MFPSSSNSNYHQSFPCTNDNQLEKSLAITNHDDQNPNHEKCYDYPPFLEDDGVILSYLLSQQHLLLGCTSTSSCQAEMSVVASNQDLEALMDNHADKEITTISKTSKKDNGGASTKPAEVPARKRRTGKKDRHSKICTAQGPRDRRMRLSLPIARKFFDLQDILGFDKASKTIEWLFSKSKTAIKELKQNLSPGLAQSSTTNNIIATTTSTESSEVVSNTRPNVSKNKMMMMRKLCTVAKESRAEARARARERTIEKMRIRSSSSSSNQTRSHHPHQVNPNHFCSAQQMTKCAQNPTINHQLFGANSEEGEEEDYDFPGFPGNWVINNSKMQSSSILPYTTTTSTTSNALQLNPSSIFMITQDQNPNSSFINTAIAQDQNPSTTALFLHSYI